MMSTLFQEILSTSLAVSFVIAPVLLALPLLHRRYPPSVSCCVWLILAIRLLVPIAPTPPQIVIPIGEEAAISSREPSGALAETLAEPENQPGAAHAERPLWSEQPFDLLALLWLAGAVLCMAAQGGMHLRMRKKLLRWSIQVEDERTIDILEACKKERGVSQNVALMRCGLLTTPMLMGMLSPCVLLPNTELTAIQLRHIFLHELTHHRRRDLWVKLLLLFVRSVHWFNPLAWMLVNGAQADLEVACDAALLKGSGAAARREYGDSILSFLRVDETVRIPLTTSFFGNRKQILRRFETIMDTKTRRGGVLVTAVILAAAVCSTALVGCVNAQTVGVSSVGPEAVRPEQSVAPPQDEWRGNTPEDPAEDQSSQQAFQEGIEHFYASGMPELSDGQMTWPVVGHTTVSAFFGWRYHGTDYHIGMDISDADIDAAPVSAASDGTVAFVNTEDTVGMGYGIYVILDHGDKCSTIYAHLSEALVKQGDWVQAGQVIGSVGATGAASAPQLHFEVREDGLAVNPQPYLLPLAQAPSDRG